MEAVYLVYNTGKTYVRYCVDGMRDFSAPLRDRVSKPQTQKRLILLIVCLALLLDNMLYMVIVPIIDDYFKSPNDGTALPAVNATVSQQRFSPTAGSVGSGYSVDPGSNATKTDGLTTELQSNYRPLRENDRHDGMMGLLFASKAIVQLSINPFTGAFIDRVGYVTPLTMGLIVMFTSTTVFACAETYGWLFVARSMQGLGSALADTASFGLIADRFQNEAERSKALGIALAFISFGSLVAPPFGGVLYEFAGRQVPFVILAFVCLIDALLLLLVKLPSEEEERAKEGNMPVGTPIYKLLMDPYILVIAGSLSIANFPLAFLEPTIAKWMETTMDADPWQIGLVWLPPFLPHVLGVLLTVRLSAKYFRYQWACGAAGLVIIGVSTATVATCKSYGVLIFPLSLLCFGIALIDTALLPTMAFLVDVRHTSVYGSVYAIADISYSVAYALGPVLAGQAVQVLGYLEMNLIIGAANILFAPVLLVLRKVYDWNVDRGERAMLLPETPGDGFAETYQVKPLPRHTSMSSTEATVGSGGTNGHATYDRSLSSTPTSEGGSAPSTPDRSGVLATSVSDEFSSEANRIQPSSAVAGKSKLGHARDSIKIIPRPRPKPRHSLNEIPYETSNLNWIDSPANNNTKFSSQENLPTLPRTGSRGAGDLSSASAFIKTHEYGFEVRNPLFDESSVSYAKDGE